MDSRLNNLLLKIKTSQNTTVLLSSPSIVTCGHSHTVIAGILSPEYLKSLLFTFSSPQVSELQAPPQCTTIDMSLNRTQLPPTTTTTTAPDNNAANTEHTDLDTLPAEEGGIADEDPKPRNVGSAKSTQSSHHSQVVDDSNNSKPEGTQEGETQQGSGEKEGEEENNSVVQPESTVKGEGVADSGEERANGEATNLPEEEIVEEEEVMETKEEEEERPPSHKAEEASKLEATNDTTVEEVPKEQLEKEEMDPPTAAGDGGEPEPEEVEPQPNKDGSHEEEQDATTEPLDTSVPEEIVVRFHAVTLIHIQFLFVALIFFYNLIVCRRRWIDQDRRTQAIKMKINLLQLL